MSLNLNSYMHINSGFKHTYIATICLMDKLISAMENGEIGIGIFMDFGKAFDTVDH